jgi:toxin ParE1/3/4
MTYHVEMTEPAEQDIMDAVKYISEQLHNPIAADRLLDEAAKAISSLEEMPKRQSLVRDDHLARIGFRLFPVRNYLLFYVVREKAKKVVIERFLYGGRDWISILKRNTELPQ